MPELPEVETVCRDLNAAGFLGDRITGVSVLWERTLGGLSREVFTQTLTGRRFLAIHRRGKYLVFSLDGGWTLLVHLRMSGSLGLYASTVVQDTHDRVIIRFSSKQLRFHDPRKFGRMLLTETPHDILGKLGIEPLSSDLDHIRFHSLLQERRGCIKSLLLDQRFIAGIGNIYADESLFSARIHPRRIANTLTKREAGRLLEAIRKHLSQAIEHRGTSLGTGEGNFSSEGKRGGHGNELHAFGRTGQPCPACGTNIERTVIAQRATHFCPRCQCFRRQ